MQEQQVNAANHIVRLTIDTEKLEYSVDIFEGMETVYLGCSNAEEARKLYDCLLNVNLMTAHCCGKG